MEGSQSRGKRSVVQKWIEVRTLKETREGGGERKGKPEERLSVLGRPPGREWKKESTDLGTEKRETGQKDGKGRWLKLPRMQS